MKPRLRPTGLVILAVAGLAAAHGQELHAVADSGETQRVIVIDPGITLGTPILLLPPSLDERGTFIVPPFITPAAFPGRPMPFLTGPAATPIDLLAPLRLQRARENELKTLRTLLGTVQIGGVAYIAYRHLKKRGVIK